MQLRKWVGVVAAAALVVAGGPAAAQEKAFKIDGAGAGPIGLPLPGQDPRPHWAIGEATHLGRYFGEGSVRTDSANLVFHEDGSITGEFGSGVPFAFEGANGDVLACHYGRADHGAASPGTFTLVPTGNPDEFEAFWIAEFVPFAADCTGKFQGVTGSWIMYAMSAPFILGSSDPILYVWEGEGTLTFAKK